MTHAHRTHAHRALTQRAHTPRALSQRAHTPRALLALALGAALCPQVAGAQAPPQADREAQGAGSAVPAGELPAGAVPSIAPAPQDPEPEQPPYPQPTPPPEVGPARPAPPTVVTDTGPAAQPDAARARVPAGEEARMARRDVGAGAEFRPGKGLRLTSEDDDFQLTLRFRAQLLWELEAAAGADPAHQLTVRRARVSLSGHVFGEHNRFKLELAFSPRDLGVRDNLGGGGPSVTPILDAYVELTHLRDLSLQAGLFKVPFNRQRLVSSGDLQLVDRSIVTSELTLDRDVGLALFSDDLFGADVLRYAAGVFIARGRDAVGMDDFGLLYAARVDLTPLGAFDDMSESDFERSSAPRFGVGAVIGYADRARLSRVTTGSAPADGGTTDVLTYGADATFKVAGLSAVTEVIVRTGERDPGGAVDAMGIPIPVEAPADGLGWMAQAGYLLPGLPLEVAARYGMVRRLGDATESTVGDENEAGLGLSWFFARHAYKLQLDAFRLWESDLGEGETRVRLQLQAGL